MARRSRLCQAGLAAYFVAHLLAIVIAAMGAKGLLGFEPGGLSAIWLIFLGMPWSLALGFLPEGSIPEIWALFLLGLAPAVNLWLFSLTCRKRRRT